MTVSKNNVPADVLLSGQKGRDAVKTDRSIGSARSASLYRHPLVARISGFLVSLEALADPVARRKVRWTPLAAGLAAVLMTLDPGCPLGVRCEDALACMGTDFIRRRRVGRTYNGLVKALQRQAPFILPVLKADLRRQARARLDRIPRTGGWTLLAVDGSKEDLPRTRDHEREFGIADNGKSPQAFVTAIVEVQTGLPWDWRIDRGCAGEKGHLIQMAPDLPADALLLGDGNFVGYRVWAKLHESGKHFLIRVGGNVSLLTKLWPDAAWQRDRELVYAWPKKHQDHVAPLELRLIKVGRGQKAVFLLTNVLDPCRLAKPMAGAIYRLRWGVELFYRTLKRTLGYAKLRSKAGRRARIELEWGLITMTLMAMMGIDALRRRRRDPRRLSPAPLIRSLRASLLRGSNARPHQAKAMLSRALAASVKDHYQRHAPKRSRYRPVTRITPSPLVLKPPRVRPATTQERKLARKYRQTIAA